MKYIILLLGAVTAVTIQGKVEGVLNKKKPVLPKKNTLAEA